MGDRKTFPNSNDVLSFFEHLKLHGRGPKSQVAKVQVQSGNRNVANSSAGQERKESIFESGLSGAVQMKKKEASTFESETKVEIFSAICESSNLSLNNSLIESAQPKLPQGEETPLHDQKFGKTSNSSTEISCHWISDATNSEQQKYSKIISDSHDQRKQTSEANYPHSKLWGVLEGIEHDSSIAIDGTDVITEEAFVSGEVKSHSGDLIDLRAKTQASKLENLSTHYSIAEKTKGKDDRPQPILKL